MRLGRFRNKKTALAAAVGAVAIAAGALVTANANAATTATAPTGWRVVGSAQGTTGPYQVNMAVADSLADHEIFYPADLSKVAKPMPVLVWGNGACIDNANETPNMFKQIASYGFLVVVDGGLGFTLKTEGPNELGNGLDWAVKQNTTAGSPLQGKVDTANLAAGGFSCGGLEALHLAGSDPRIKTTIAFSSGLFGNHGPQLAKIKGTIAWIEGGPADIAYSNGLADFNAAPAGKPVVFASLKGYFHGGTIWPTDAKNGGASGAAVLAWLQFQLQNDPQAAKQFTGANCGLCTNPAWNIKRKNL